MKMRKERQKVIDICLPLWENDNENNRRGKLFLNFSGDEWGTKVK